MSTQNLEIRTKDALDVFDGSVAKLASFLSIRPAAIYQWGEFVPQVRAYQLRDSHPSLATSGQPTETAINGGTAA